MHMHGCSEFPICPLISPTLGVSARNFAFLDEHFPTKTKFFDNFSTAQNLEGGQLRLVAHFQDATEPLRDSVKRNLQAWLRETLAAKMKF